MDVSKLSNKFAILLFGIILPLMSISQIKALNGNEILRQSMDTFVVNKMHMLNIPGLSIAFINNGRIVYRKVFGYSNLEAKIKVTEKTIFEAASLSKSVFALYVLHLAQQKIISLDTPLYRYLPYPDIAYDDRYKLITARMVLSHTSGLPNWRSDSRDSPIPINNYPLYLKFTPGSRFSYSGEGYIYLSRVIEHLLNTDKFTLGKKLYRDIFIPYGMKHSLFGWNNYIRQHKAIGYINNGEGTNTPGQTKHFIEFDPAGGLHTNAAEFARWIIAMMKLQQSDNPYYQEMFIKQSYPEPNEERDAWGLGLHIKHTNYGIRYGHSGNNGDFQAYYIMVPAKRSGFVFFINNNRAGAFYNDLSAFFETGIIPVEKKSISIAAEKLTDYTGEYQTAGNLIMKITSQNNKLYLQQSNNPSKFELFCSEPNYFFFKTDPALIRFIQNIYGKIIEMELTAGGATHILKKVN